MEKSTVVVIGLGRFGLSLAKTLSARGHEVLGLDTDMKNVEAATEFVTQAVRVDATDEDALVELGVRDFDIGVVAIGADIKSSVMVALLLEKLGVKRVIAKAYDELHGEILRRIGVETIVFPERDTGNRLAHAISIPNAVDYMDVMAGYGLAKIVVPESLSGKHIGDLDLRGKFGINVLVLQRRSEVIVNPSMNEVISEGNVLILSGRDDALDAIRSLGL